MRAATVRGFARNATAGVFSEINEAFNPRSLPNLAAWFDALDTRTMLAGDGTTITDGGAVALWADKSGNSNVNTLVCNGVNANGANFTALTAIGTGDFTVTAYIQPSSLAALGFVIGAGTNGFGIKVNTNGTLQTTLRNSADNTASTGTVAALAWVHIAYVRSGTTGTYYIATAAAGTTTDSRNYSVGIDAVGNDSNSAKTNAFNGLIRYARTYSAALDAAGIAADAAGTVQANNVLNCDFSLAAKKLANGDTFVCSTGQTVTLNSSGATGARIAGGQDYYQGTLASRGLYDAAGRFITTDGSDDYYKQALYSLPQPVTLYAIMEQSSWTSGDYLIDGSASDTMALIQTTTTPQLNISAGSSVAANTGLATATKALVTIVSDGASSLLSINRLVPTTGNAGAGVPNGTTLASKGTAGSYGHARWYELAIYRGAHDQATRHRWALYAGRKRGFAV